MDWTSCPARVPRQADGRAEIEDAKSKGSREYVSRGSEYELHTYH